MNKVLHAALTVTLILTGTASAQSQSPQSQSKPKHDRQETVDQPKRTQDRSAPANPQTSNSASPSSNRATRSHPFTTGSRFSRASAPSYRRVDHRESGRLSAPAKGFIWVRAGNDALLVRLANNVVTRVVSDVF